MPSLSKAANRRRIEDAKRPNLIEVKEQELCAIFSFEIHQVFSEVSLCVDFLCAVAARRVQPDELRPFSHWLGRLTTGRLLSMLQFGEINA